MILPSITLTLAEGHAPSLVRDILVILATAAAVATLFRRMGLEAIPGYLVAGVLIGPGALALVPDEGNIQQVTELATILLMFGIGLQLDLNHIRRGMGPILIIGVASTIVCAIVGWPIARFFGFSRPAGLAVAMALAISSTAVLLRVLAERREIRQLHGRVCVGASIAQDILSVIILAMLPPLERWAGSMDPTRVGQAVDTAVAGVLGPAGAQAPVSPGWDIASKALIALGGVGCLLAIGRYILPTLMQTVARAGMKQGASASDELLLVLAGAVAVGSAVLSSLLGLSPELGAFLAGFMLGFTPFRFQISGQVAPLRDLLMAVFFTSVGLKLHPAAIGGHWVVIASGFVCLIVVKSSLIGLSAWVAGTTASAAVLIGVYLANAGEFSLIVISESGKKHLLTSDQQGIVIAITVLSLIASPMLVTPAHTFSRLLARHIGCAPWLTKEALSDIDNEDAGHSASALPRIERHVIIAGYGPVGRTLADRLARDNVVCTIVELNAKTVSKQAAMGRRVVYGDITNREVLESAGIATAVAVVFTIPDDEATHRGVAAVRRAAPAVFIAARADFLSQALTIRQMGADHVTVEEIATADAMQKEFVRMLQSRLGPLSNIAVATNA